MNESLVIKYLCEDRKYFTTVIQYLRYDDLVSQTHKDLLKGILEYYDRYKEPPSIEELKLFVQTSGKFHKTTIQKLNDIIVEIKNLDSDINEDLLYDSTEHYIKNVRFERELEQGVLYLEGDKSKSIEEIQDSVKEIVSFTFKSSDGHDYFDDAEKRFLSYGQAEEQQISPNIEILKQAGMGKRKTIGIYAGSSNAGKTCHMCSYASDALLSSWNVGYFTFEDGEEGIASRIDENLMDYTLEELKARGTSLKTSFQKLIRENMGRLKIKEFSSGTANNIRKVLEDWKLKDSFVPDIIFVDYIGEMESVKQSNSTYERNGYVTKELRAIAIDYNISVITATQLQRGKGQDSLTMDDVADSMGVPRVADTMIGIIEDDNHDDRQLLTILKSRSVNKKSVKPQMVKVDTEHQRVNEMSETRLYVKKEQKEKIEQLNNFVEQAESNDDLLDDLISGKF